MKKFIVNCEFITGKKNRTYKKGDTVYTHDFRYEDAKKLIESGALVDEFIEPTKIEGKLKVAIVTAVWKRPEIFEMFAKGVKHLIENSEIEFHVIVAGSEWDASKKMVEKHGFTYIEIPNEPLAAKVNATTYACRNLGVHYVLCVGSDDIIHPDLMKEYEKHMLNGIDFIGVTDFYFYDTNSDKSAYWGGYRENNRKNATCGAGRLISARLLKQWDWMPWENKHSKILDNSIDEKLRNTKHTKHIFSLKELNLFGLDIKSSTNMTPFKLWDNTHFIDSKIIKEKFYYVWD